jgi:hypothetical protein
MSATPNCNNDDSCPECGETGNEGELCSTCLPEGPQWTNEDWREFYADDRINDGESPDGPRYLDASKPNPTD